MKEIVEKNIAVNEDGVVIGTTLENLLGLIDGILIRIEDNAGFIIYDDNKADESDYNNLIKIYGQEYVDFFSLEKDCIVITLQCAAKDRIVIGGHYFVDLPPAIGDEIGGHRECEIISIHSTAELAQIVPYHFNNRYDDYIMTISFERIKERIDKD
jgi:hypothetical protein